MAKMFVLWIISMMPMPDPNYRERTSSIDLLSLQILNPFCVPMAKQVWSWLKLMYRIYSFYFYILLCVVLQIIWDWDEDRKEREYCLLWSLTDLRIIQKYKKRNRMSLLYFWGRPITKSLFQLHSNNQQVLPLDKHITQVSAGEKHCVVVMGDSVVGFGDGSEGQLGEIEDSSQEIVPISLMNNYKICLVSCGWNFTLLLDEGGNVYSAGRGEQGELGRGKTCNFHKFQVVIKGAKQISAGKDHSLALCGSKVMGWGNSKQGQLGLLIKKTYFYPQELNVYPCTFIFAGMKYSLFVTSKGVYGTGMNQNCQLGLGHENNMQVPRKLAIDEEIVAISGGNYCAAKTRNNEWYLWGSGGFGVFKYPTKMSYLKDGEEVSMGLNFGLLSKNGQVWVWGSNKWGELGIEEECKDYTCEATDISNLNLKGFACGCNFTVGYTNEVQSLQHSMSNQQIQEKENSSISRELFKNFKNSSGGLSSNTFKDRNQPNEWTKYYEIQHQYDLVDPSPTKKGSLSQSSQPQEQQPFTKKHQGNIEGYLTWQGQNNHKRVNLTNSLKSLTNFQWRNIQKQNKSLKERLHNERLQKERIRDQYLHLLNINQDNKIYNKILDLQTKIHSKKTTFSKKTDQTPEELFSQKLSHLKSLLQRAYE